MAAKQADDNSAPGVVLWKSQTDDHDYPAAANYLNLVLEADRVCAVVAALRDAPVTTQRAKDILRASRLALLELGNSRVKLDLLKVIQGRALSPVLLVRGNAISDAPLIVADGYHRVCVSYHIDENTDIPCKIVNL